MKNLMIGFLSLFSLFGFSTQGDTNVDLKSIEYIDDEVVLTLQATSDNMMVIEQDFTYDPTEFKISDIDYNSYFTYTQGPEKENEDGTKTIKMLFDSTYSFKTIEYAQIHLMPLEENVDSNIELSNMYSADVGYTKEFIYGSEYEIILNDEDLKVVSETKTLRNQIKDWIIKNRTQIIIALICILILLMIIKIIENTIKKKKQNKKAFTDNATAVNVQQQQVQQQNIQTNTNQNIINQPVIANNIPAKTSEEIKQEKKEDKISQADLKEIEDKEKYDPISDDVFKGKYEIFILLLLVSSLILMIHPYAEENDKTNQIRENIVNEKAYDSSLDYNGDKKVDIVDLVYSIGTNDTVNKGYINFKSGKNQTTEVTTSATNESN